MIPDTNRPETDRVDAGQGAGRFARRTETPERRTAEAVGAALALLGLVVLVPAVLLWLGGAPPVPTELPDRESLTQPLTTDMLLTVLVAVVWLAWVVFCLCVVVEVVAAVRGGLARPVPLAGPLQGLARTLVGAVLITGVLTGPAANAVTVAAAPVSSGPVAVATTADIDSPGVQDPSAHRVSSERGSVAEPGGDRVEDLVGKKVYTVKAPQGGYHDNLWDIAERHLGDGRRYREVFDLNHGRVQADGRALDLARLIQPGWQLVMPDDAVGVARMTAPDRAVGQVPSPAPPGEPASTDQGSAGGSDDGPAGATEDGAVGATEDGAPGFAESGPVPGVLGAGLLAAGIISALAAARRRRLGRAADDEAAAVEAGLRAAATPDRAAALDRTMRGLVRHCLDANVPVPSIYAAVLDDHSVELLLAPARQDACPGWEVLDEGRRWRHGTDVEPQPDHAVAPFPGLVSLGVDDRGRDVLVDLEAAGGVVSVVGPDHVVGQVAAAIAVQQATSAWSTAVRVTASDVPHGLAEVGDDRIRVVTDWAEVLPHLEAGIEELRDGVLTGRLARRGTLAPTHLLVAAAQPDPCLGERLAALTGSGRQSLSVVVAGDSPAARWQLRVDDHGHLTVPALDLTVTANRVGPAEVSAIAELFSAAREDRSTHEPAPPAPDREVDDAQWAAAGHRIGLLGPVRVEGLTGLDDVRRAEATEMLAYLALHPRGVHPHVLAGAIWPRGVTEDVRDTAIERVMTALGTDPEGRNHLRRDPEGRYLLGPDVVCDWDALRTMLVRADHAPDASREAELLRRSLTVVRGEPLAAHPPGRYAWVAATQVERTMRATVSRAAHRLAVLRLDHDPEASASAAQDGLRLDPTNLELWRDVLRAADRSGGAGGVRQVVDDMGGVLERYGVLLDPQTEALVEELLPGLRALPASG